MYGLIEKTTHRPILPSFMKFGRFVRRVTIPLGIIFVLLIAPSFYASNHNTYKYGGSTMYGPDTRLGRDTIKVEEIFGENDTYVLMVPRGDNSAEHSLIRDLRDDPRVLSVLAPVSVIGDSMPAELLPDSIIDQLRTDDYDRLIINVNAPPESEKTFKLVEDVYTIADKYYNPDEYHLAGVGVSVTNFKNVVAGDMLRVNIIAIGAIFLILLIMMRNLLLPVILVLTIETAIWINMSLSFITGSPVFYLIYLIITSVQLGATVDYAILFTERYKENRRLLGLEPGDCIVRTISDTAVSILTSASAVSAMGFLLGIVSTHGMISQLVFLLGRGSVCSLFAVLLALPGFLMLADKHIFPRTRNSRF
jgi:hypothetical protein